MKSIVTLSLIFLLMFALTACTNKTESKTIVCTTTIVSDLVNNIKPPSISLMGPGVDPHLYKSKSGDHQSLNNAEVIVYSGLHLEGKMTSALQSLSKQKKVIALTDGIEPTKLIRSKDFGASFDPHFWFDIDLYKSSVEYCAKELQSHFTEDSILIAQNTTKYLIEIDKTTQLLLNEVSQLPVPNRVLITAHDAFSYFGKKYNFNVIGIQGASTASEAGLKDITMLVDYIIKEKVPSIFVEASVSERNVKAIIEGCKSKGHDLKLGGTLYSDALGGKDSGADTYLSMMQTNINTIISALKDE